MCARRSFHYQPSYFIPWMDYVLAWWKNRKICSWMLKEKILVRVTEDIVYRRATIEEMKSRIRDRYRPGARFGVAEFKELFDLTRKHAIPLLEHLDRERFTRRQGSERILL